MRHKKNHGQDTQINQYECSFCEYHTNHKSHFDDHITSKSHQVKKEMILKNLKQNQCNQCLCEFKSQTTLWRHKKKCKVDIIQSEKLNIEPANTWITPEVLVNMMKLQTDILTQNQQQQQENMQQFMTSVVETINHSTNVAHSHNNNTNTTNSHNNTVNNKTFNMNFFLNEQCKNAMDINDFIKTLNYTQNNLLENPHLSYTDRISNQIKDGIRNSSVEERPIHCSDIKRSKLHIKENGEWLSGDDSKKKLQEIIAKIGYANWDAFREWVNENPMCSVLDSKDYEKFMCIYQNVLGPISDAHEERNMKKVLQTIVETTAIDKDKYAI